MTTETLTAEPFVSGLFFGECPRWHDGRLWYSDFFDRTVLSVSPDGERRVEVEFDGEPAGLGWLPDGRLLINSRLDRVIYRREPDGTLVEHGDLKPYATWHANDMVVASNGQAYAGNFGFDLDGLSDGTVDASAIGPASLIRVDPDGTSSEAAGELAIPQRCGDHRRRRDAHHRRELRRPPERLRPGRRRHARQSARAGPRWTGIAPDGICLCADGSVWVANALAAECVRVAEGGEVLERVTTSRNCYACMLGDDDRRTLYLVTAVDSNASVARASRNGALEKVRTTVPGAGLP